MTNNFSLNAVVTLLTSVSHIGETNGINAEFHRVKMMQPDGQPERVPTITGNSARGQIRDYAALHLVDTLQLEPLSLPAFYTLFSGGSLSKSGGSFGLDGARRLRTLLPPLSLLGAGVGNHIMPGRVKVGMLVPLAKETAHLVPGQYDWLCTQSVYDLMQTEPYTRMDDAKRETLQGYLLPDQERGDGPAQQMRYEVETLAAGVKLYWNVHFAGASDLDVEAFISALARWSQHPHLGGKSAVGHGVFAAEFDNDWRIAPGNSQLPALDHYNQYLLDHKAEIEAVLHEL